MRSLSRLSTPTQRKYFIICCYLKNTKPQIQSKTPLKTFQLQATNIIEVLAMDIFGDDFGESPAPQALVSSGDSGLPAASNLDDFGGLVATDAPVLASPGEGGSLFDATGDQSTGGDMFPSSNNVQISGSDSLAAENGGLFAVGTDSKEDALTNSLEDSVADPAQDFIEKEKKDLADIGLEMGIGESITVQQVKLLRFKTISNI